MRSLRQVSRFQCLFIEARRRVASLQCRASPGHIASFPFSNSSRYPITCHRQPGAYSNSPLQAIRPHRLRPFSTTGRRHAPQKTVQQAKSRYMVGPISVLSVTLFLGAGVGLYLYFQFEKARMERKRIADATKGVGKPKVGGPFELVDQEGRTWGSERMKGRFALVYFGFTHCPDICPEELDKMALMLDAAREAVPPASSSSLELLPVFITCDPARDTPSVLKTYLSEFHEDIVGLTGEWEQIKAVCRLYRVYFSTPKGIEKGTDYLVDHSIYFYLMDPEGDFVEAIGRQHTAEQGAKLIIDHMKDWKGSIAKR